MLNSDFIKVRKICRCILSSTSNKHIIACERLVSLSKLDKTSINHLEDLLKSQKVKVEANA